MKVAILMLSYERYDTLSQVLPANIDNAGCEVDLYVLEQGSKDPRVYDLLASLKEGVGNLRKGKIIYSDVNMGIAGGFNHLLWSFPNYNYYQLMANDIVEPPGWVSRKLEAYDHIPGSGLVSICPGQHSYAPRCVDGMWHHPGDVIGQFMLRAEVFEKVGYFRNDFGPYGPIDNDYNVRCRKAGFTNYYLAGLQSIHLDDHDNTLYGYDKAAAVRDTWPKFMESLNDSEYFIPNGECIINAKQHV